MKKNINRRKFVQTATTAAVGTAALSACSSLAKRDPSAEEVRVDESDKFDFIIVGSGAGGGPLAAGLAKKLFKVLLIEAGGAENDLTSKTPVMHAKASEDPLLNWSFFVERYDKLGPLKIFEELNNKFQKKEGGVLYPRAAGLGGCTRVNAMISLYPENRDWDKLSDSLSAYHFQSPQMTMLFKKMQKNHGGWLNLDQASPLTLIKDRFLISMALSALGISPGGVSLEVAKKIIVEQYNLTLNPNYGGYTSLENKYNGAYNIPFNATNGVREGVREYILETQKSHAGYLFIKTHSLCTRLLFDQNNKTSVVGVEFIEGAHAYKADVLNQDKARSSSYVKKSAYAAKEVILAGGAFNTPQLLMLSGIGPSESIPTSIPLVKNLPGVGRNLQDRYEVSVVSELNKPISLLKDCTFAQNNDFANDPCFQEYLKDPKGHLYGTNGIALSLIRKSSAKQESPDLCIFGVPGRFTGYYPGYSNDATPKRNAKNEMIEPSYFTWAILKGHTKNHAGTVSLRSADPKDTPLINFKYFQNEQGGAAEDLDAIFEGLQVARRINSKIGSKYFKKEVYPGEGVQGNDSMKSWIQREAWGHHASCTNKMGLASDNMAVVDSQFKVHGVQNLRIVDASVFPDIPGLFIMIPTLMMSEKAKEIILEQYNRA
ncbi:MAG: GMC family oxidoreductase N-terminal domain-containing protein [Bdellovibrionaceae bacterium]|nr:GMC family oxidoreductase N-terminal domain-containing protein [Pseudobdellovibrionaceae bacterium]